MTEIRYDVSKTEVTPTSWVVTSVEPGEPIARYVSVFHGNNAEMRAREYATWKNVFAGGSKNGINGGLFRA